MKQLLQVKIESMAKLIEPLLKIGDISKRKIIKENWSAQFFLGVKTFNKWENRSKEILINDLLEKVKKAFTNELEQNRFGIRLEMDPNSVNHGNAPVHFIQQVQPMEYGLKLLEEIVAKKIGLDLKKRKKTSLGLP
ncbi:MAG: hypothetical protein HYX67_05165 [Candidatus Melainabacteria bacterium]|nr:hypothetical protein [Candidatus Melainabacteria bacterium]